MSEAQPPLPRPIRDRLADLRLHRDTLLYTQEQFGEGFPRERFVAAATSRDPAERAHVLAVERAFEIVVNTMTELAVEGLVAAGHRQRGDELPAPRALREFRDQGGIGSDVCDRLIALHRTRNDLQHEYPAVQASTLHTACAEVPSVLAGFMRGYAAWLREHVLVG